MREPFAVDRKGRIKVKLDINEVAVLGQLVPLSVAEVAVTHQASWPASGLPGFSR